MSGGYSSATNARIDKSRVTARETLAPLPRTVSLLASRPSATSASSRYAFTAKLC